MSITGAPNFINTSDERDQAMRDEVLRLEKSGAIILESRSKEFKKDGDAATSYTYYLRYVDARAGRLR